MAWGAGIIKEGSRGPDVEQLQHFLKNRGFLADAPGNIDGIFGPKTKAALMAYQRSVGFSGRDVDGIVGPKTWEKILGAQGQPQEPASPAASGGDIADKARKEFPFLAIFLDVPELRPLLQQAMDEGFTTEQFEARIRNTDWWRRTTQVGQQWVTLSPAEKESRIQETAARIVDHNIQVYGRGWLVKNAPWKLEINSSHTLREAENVASGTWAWEVFQFGNLTAAMKFSETAAGIAELERQEDLARKAKRPEKIAEELWQLAHSDYFVQISKDAARGWANDIIAGRSSYGEFNDFLRGQASTLYATYAEPINNGVLPGDLFAPAFGIFERELGMSKAQILANDRIWSEITTQAAGGKPQFTAADWKRYIRETPEWESSENGRREGAELGSRIRNLFQNGRSVA